MNEHPSQPDRPADLQRLDRLCDQFEADWQAKRSPSLDDFLSQAPEPQRPHVFRELLGLELEYLHDDGNPPSKYEYLQRYPQYADSIHQLFEQFDEKSSNTLQISAFEVPTQSPRWFDEFELIQELGRGGMGAVYKARQFSLERIVAIKLIRTGQKATSEEIDRFLVEAKAAARLQHPGIVAVYEVGQASRQHYFAMEFVDGQSLKEMIRAAPLSAYDAARYTQEVADAIHYAHEQGVLHRDLKPSNVLVDKSGRARVTDFGLAKRVESDVELTATGQVMGTPGYMSPEQAMGETSEVDRRSDVYALGAVLYALLTREAPFRGESTMATLMQVVHKKPRPLHEINPDADAALERICLKCLEKDPDQRFQTAQELADDLSQFLRSESQAETPLSEPKDCRHEDDFRPANRTQMLESQPVDRAASWKKRNLIIGGSVIGLVLVLGIVFWATRGSEGEPPSDGTFAKTNGKAPKRSKSLEVKKPVPADAIWKPGPNEDILPGLVPRPAVIPGVKRWQLETTNARDLVDSVAFSPDGRMLACGSKDGCVRTYEVGSRRLLRVFPGHVGRITDIEWAWDSKRLAVAIEQGQIHIWESNGQPGPMFETGLATFYDIAWSPDNQWLSVGGNGEPSLRLFKADGTPGPWEKNVDQVIGSLAWCPKNRWLASGSIGNDHLVRLWKPDGAPGPKLNGHTSAVVALAWNSDGTWLASGGADGSLRLWQADGTHGPVIKDFPASITSISWEPNGQWLTVQAHTELFKCQVDGRPPDKLKDSLYCAALSPDGQRLATASSRGIILLDPTGSVEAELKRHTAEFSDLAFSPDGQSLAVSTQKDRLQIWNADGTPDHILHGIEGFSSVAWSPDGRWLAAAEYYVGKHVSLWETDGTPEPVELDGHTAPVTGVAWSPDSQQVASCSGDGTVRRWNVDGTSAGEPLQHSSGSAVYDVGWNKDWLVSAGHGGQLRFWRPDGSAGPIFDKETMPIYSLAFRPDGRWLAVGGGGGRALLKLLKPDRTGELILKGHSRAVRSVAWSPDGQWLASGGHDTTVRLWNADATPISVLAGHTSWVRAVDFHPDGKRLVSGSVAGVMRFWNADSGDAERVAVLLSNGQSVILSTAGELLDGDPDALEEQFVYIIEKSTGTLEVMKPSEFQSLLKHYDTDPSSQTTKD